MSGSSETSLDQFADSTDLGCSITDSDDISPIDESDSAPYQQISSSAVACAYTTLEEHSGAQTLEEAGSYESYQSNSAITANFSSNSISNLFAERPIPAAEVSCASAVPISSEEHTMRDGSSDVQVAIPQEIQIGDREAVFTQKVGYLQKRLNQALAQHFERGLLYFVFKTSTFGYYTFVSATLEGAPELKTLILKCQNFSGDGVLVYRSLRISAQGVQTLRARGYDVAADTQLCLDWETRLRP